MAKKTVFPAGEANRSRTVAQKPSSADRASYFARREAAKVLRSVLHGDAERRASASIKSLVYSPSVKNKRATFALVCQTLKYLPIIKDVLESAGVINSKWKNRKELLYIVAYDSLFGKKGNICQGEAEKYLRSRDDALDVALAKLLVKHKLKNIDQLASLCQSPEIKRPCYVRVNTLKIDVETALQKFETDYEVLRDDIVSDLLILPADCDLHGHPLVLNGSVFVQGKGSSMVAAALDPKPGSEVIDACAAPGNKTVHLAALMKGTGRIMACELNKERLTRLEDTVRLSGAANIKIVHDDFLNLNPSDPKYAKVSCILLDPSCSGSGTAAQRLDHLLPSYGRSCEDTERLKKLAAFQRRALSHALSFPAVERIVYSTCSVNQMENEDVVAAIAPLAKSSGFHLVAPFPQWQRRGVSGGDSDCYLRLDPVEDKEGFFIALFVRDVVDGDKSLPSEHILEKTKPRRYFSYTRLSRVLIFSHIAGNFLNSE